MSREDMVMIICGVLGAHDVAEYASWCCCGKKLYHVNDGGTSGEGAMSLRRHRAECLVDALALDVAPCV